MPNLTFYIDGARMPQESARYQLSAVCTRLCTELLGAGLSKVHIVYVPVLPGVGHPVFAELLYRQGRGPALMERFMDGLDAAMVEHIGMRARIRCFAATDIHARN